MVQGNRGCHKKTSHRSNEFRSIPLAAASLWSATPVIPLPIVQLSTADRYAVLSPVRGTLLSLQPIPTSLISVTAR